MAEPDGASRWRELEPQGLYRFARAVFKVGYLFKVILEKHKIKSMSKLYSL